MKAGFLTLGCKVNQYETQAMREQLVQAGYLIAEDGEIPDVFIINSCTVTAESDRKTRQAVRKYRRMYPGSVLVLTGCMPQAFPEEGEALTDADIVLGNTDHGRLIPAIDAHLTTGGRIVEISQHERGEKFERSSISNFFERTRAYLKIEDGCDRFCSYCIIPKARGRVRSKPLDEIHAELLALSEHYPEVVLVGINLSAYGRDSGQSLCDAVELAASVPNILRIRLGSMEPDQLTPDVCARLAAVDKLCPHFHLSLQSGCDATLRRMNRHYTTAEYRCLCDNLRSLFPDAAITTDIMVGFPGETRDEFEQSMAFVREIGFARAHIFAYSRREGTPAAGQPDQVSKSEKTLRSREMAAVADACAHTFLQQMIGKTVRVLIEAHDGGYTPNYTFVKIKTDRNLSGRFADVLITGTEGDQAVGVLTEKQP